MSLKFHGILQLYTHGPVLPTAKTSAGCWSCTLNIHEKPSGAAGSLEILHANTELCGSECVWISVDMWLIVNLQHFYCETFGGGSLTVSHHTLIHRDKS